MFQCNEHVEMNNVLCSLACTWMTIIDSDRYFNTDWQFEMFKRGKPMDMILA